MFRQQTRKKGSSRWLWLKLIVWIESRVASHRHWIPNSSHGHRSKKLSADPQTFFASLIPSHARFSSGRRGFIRGKQISRTWHRSGCETKSFADLLLRSLNTHRIGQRHVKRTRSTEKNNKRNNEHFKDTFCRKLCQLYAYRMEL